MLEFKDPEATIRSFRIVQTEGRRSVTRLIDHYSLTTILAVGYRLGHSVELLDSVDSTDRVIQDLSP